ncbi:lipase 3 isoform 1-T3 [Glossina fuscipes fuscipes]
MLHVCCLIVEVFNTQQTKLYAKMLGKDRNFFLYFLIIKIILMNIGDQMANGLKVTAKLISIHSYPVEEHTVQTDDDYILTVYRIPDSPKLKNVNSSYEKPVVFFQHGILCSSDDWILSESSSLAFMLVDMGYDVWLGNARGNTYSRQHKHKHPDSSDFWNFSWHEIGIYDLAAMLDYALDETKASSVHFVAHSQGTTTFFVLMSTMPWYNEKVRTVHLLAPVAFLKDHSFILSKVGGLFLTTVDFLGYPSFLSMMLGGFELLPASSAQRLFCDYICSENSSLRFLCSSILHFIGGWGTRHLNQTLLPHVCETHPAGASTTQIIHYLQLYSSGDFKQYDYGIDINVKKYNQETPPHYELKNIKTCVDMYYSDNDYMSAVKDVEYLARLLPCARLFRIPYNDWNHYDFLWSVNVKEIINKRIIEKIERYEETHDHIKNT